MGIITKPYTFAGGNVADGTQINANFDPLYAQVNAATGNITPAAQTVLDDTTVAAMLATLGGAPSATAVVGPASATDNAIVRFNGNTGKLVQNSSVIIDDSGNASGLGSVNGAHIFSSPCAIANGSGGTFVLTLPISIYYRCAQISVAGSFAGWANLFGLYVAGGDPAVLEIHAIAGLVVTANTVTGTITITNNTGYPLGSGNITVVI